MGRRGFERAGDGRSGVLVVRNDGVRVAYDRPGPDDGEPVVVLEGWNDGRWTWHRQRAALDGSPTVVPDDRGTGDQAVGHSSSPSPPNRSNTYSTSSTPSASSGTSVNHPTSSSAISAARSPATVGPASSTW